MNSYLQMLGTWKAPDFSVSGKSPLNLKHFLEYAAGPYSPRPMRPLDESSVPGDHAFLPKFRDGCLAGRRHLHDRLSRSRIGTDPKEGPIRRSRARIPYFRHRRRQRMGVRENGVRHRREGIPQIAAVYRCAAILGGVRIQ